MIGQLACLWLHGRSRKTTKASTDGMEGDSVKKVESILNEDIVSALYILQGLRKHFRIGQAMKKFFCLLSSHIFHYQFQGFFMSCRCFMVFKADDGILPIPLLVKAR